MSFQYSEISVTGQLPERPDNIKEQDYKAWICSKALNDWGICMFGQEIPSNFGIGMVEVSKLLGVSATPSSLKEYADKIILDLQLNVIS